MGSKKRDLSSANEVEEAPSNDNVVGESKNKKVKKEKGMPDGGADLSGISSSVKPMERRKKRKELDKEKHRVALENKKSETKVSGAVEAPSSAGGSGGKPGLNMSLFNELASADGSVRENAVEKLVTTLGEFQRGYDGLENRELAEDELKLEAEKDDGLEDCEPSVRYAVRRLVRGVSSSRECARQGFALALTVLVRTIRSIKIQSLLKLIVESLEISSSMKGQEVKDCLLGRLFAYGALVRSGRLNEEWMSDKNTSCIKEFADQLISLAMKKRYLQEPAVSILLELVEKLPVEALLQHILESPGLLKWFDEAPEVGNPDALLLSLRLREKVSIESVAFGRLLPNPFSPRKFFTSEHLSVIANCLKESTFCQPRVHSVWPVLVKMLLPDSVLQEEKILTSSSMKKHKKGRKSSTSNEEAEKNLQSFSDVVVEGSLLLSSHDRKHLAFDVLLLLLPRLPASFIPIIMSYRLVQCLMDILSTKDSWLYKVAQYFLKELLEWVRHDDVRRVEVVVALQKHSDGKFDSITRTKTVKDLMAEFKSESGCMLFIQNLTNMFVDYGPDSEEPSDQSQTTDDNSEIGSNEDKDSTGPAGNSDILKSWVVESLPHILKHIKLDPDAKFRVQKEILKFLSVQGLFSASLGTEVTSFDLKEKFRWPKAATSSALCRMCIEQIQSLLVNAQKGDGTRASANNQESNDLGSFFIHFFCTLRSIPSVSLFHSLTEDDEKAIKKLQEMETRLSREERNCGLGIEASKLHALRYLLIQLLLQVLLRPGEFSEAATELIICCRKAFPATSLDEPGDDELDDEGGPELMDVLVDTLLSLLPHSSASTRSAIEQLFKYFCEDVTDDGLLRMLRVIKKDLKPARHQDADTESDDDDDEDLLDIEEDEEVDEEETGETAESDEHADDSETEAGAEEVSRETIEDSDDSDGGMDDDEMFKMDTYLAQIFKERKNQAGGETAHSQLVLFKLRVLSLLEIYVHENPGKTQVLTVFSNLAQAFINLQTAEGSEQLGQRIWGILQKKILKAKDYPKGEAVELPTLESLLERNLKLASKPFKRKKSALNPSKKKQSASRNRYKMITSLAQNSTFWILKIIDARNFSDSELQRVFEIFKAVFIGYFESKKSEIKPEFLKEIFRRRPWIGHNLFGFILEKCSCAKSEFRQVEALDLVVEILSSLLSPNSNKDGQVSSKKILKRHLQKLCQLVEKVVTNMPKKQSRRAAVRKFCGKVFQIVSNHNMKKPFLKNLSPEAHGACQSQFGELFTNLLNSEE